MEDEIIIRLRSLIKEKKLIPFIGTGFSATLKFPSWQDLIKSLAEKLDFDEDVFMQSGNSNFLQLAEYYQIKNSIGKLGNELSKKMIINKSKLRNSLPHTLLVKMQPLSIYTTNYDEGIEAAFKLYNKKHIVIRNINDFQDSKDGSTLIYKFHGDFSDHSSLVLTESSYFDRMQFEDPLDIRLRSDILNNTLLFLGYSLNDINIRFIFYKLDKIRKEIKKSNKSPSAIMITFGVSEIQKEILSNWNIEIIDLSPLDKTKSLTDFLSKIIPKS